MIIVSTIIGGVALSVRPITTGLFPFVYDRLNSLENYFARHANSLRVLLEDNQMLLSTWFEDEGCEVIQRDDLKTSPALLPPPLGKEKLKSPPLHVFPPKVMYKVQSQAQKPEFEPEGWLLV